MTAQIRFRDVSGTLRAATRIRVRDETGALRTIARIRMRDVSNILRTVYGALASTISPGSLSGTGTTATVVTSAAATCTPVGTAPFTYAWVSPFPDGMVPILPSAATTGFKHSGMAIGDSYESDWFCDVTDATGLTVRSSNSVNVTVTRT